MGEREKSQGHFHRNIKHGIGHVGKSLSDLSPGTWANWKWKPQAGESLTLTIPGLYLDELETECQETDSWFALTQAAELHLGHRSALWLNWSAKSSLSYDSVPDGLALDLTPELKRT